jgi:hypothetical protein
VYLFFYSSEEKLERFNFAKDCCESYYKIIGTEAVIGPTSWGRIILMLCTRDFASLVIIYLVKSSTAGSSFLTLAGSNQPCFCVDYHSGPLDLRAPNINQMSMLVDALESVNLRFFLS